MGNAENKRGDMTSSVRRIRPPDSQDNREEGKIAEDGDD